MEKIKKLSPEDIDRAIKMLDPKDVQPGAPDELRFREAVTGSRAFSAMSSSFLKSFMVEMTEKLWKKEDPDTAALELYETHSAAIIAGFISGFLLAESMYLKKKESIH